MCFFKKKIFKFILARKHTNLPKFAKISQKNLESFPLSTRLSGDLFLNFVLAALGEMPATVILYFTLNKTRRLYNVTGWENTRFSKNL